MSKVTKAIGKIADKGSDVIDKISSAGSRSGTVVERTAKLLKKKVDPAVIALQMTKNSTKGTEFTEDDIESYRKLYLESETKVPLTAEQTRALMKDQDTYCNPVGNLTPVNE